MIYKKLKEFKLTYYKNQYFYFEKKIKKYLPSLIQDVNSLNSYCDTRIFEENKCFLKLNKLLNYFILSASFADKWFILSYLNDHFKIYKNSRVISCQKDKDIIKLFISEQIINERFLFFEEDELNSILKYFRPVSKVSTQIVDSWFKEGCQHTITPFLIKNGLPPGTIRHLHEVYYPYFNELACVHGVSRGILLRTILYLPYSSKSQQKLKYHKTDYAEAYKIAGPQKQFILFNIVNYSHVELTTKQIKYITSLLGRKKLLVLLNTSGSSLSDKQKEKLGDISNARLIDVPGRLLALVSNKAFAVIGVLGGAMNIAAQFSSAHLLSLQTPARGIGVAENELLGKWGRERMWEWWDQDWPCIKNGRVILNKFIGDPATLKTQHLATIIEEFIEECKKTSVLKNIKNKK